MSINYNSSGWLKGSYENDALNFVGWFENPALMRNDWEKRGQARMALV
jgi:hypothetical protein